MILGVGQVGLGLQGLGVGALCSSLLALLRLQNAQVERRLSVGRLQEKHTGIGAHGLWDIPLRIIQYGQAVLGLNIVGLLCHDGPIGSERFLGLVLTLGQDAQAEQRFDMLRLLGNDLLVRLLGLSELVGLLKQNAQAYRKLARCGYVPMNHP